MRHRRMVSSSITTSLKVNSMTIPARLLYTWMLTRADDHGRLEGDPLHIKANVFPMTDFTGVQIAEFLNEMVKADLIIWYVAEGKCYIQINDWDKYQTFHGITRSESKLPKPTSKLVDRSTKLGVVVNQKRPYKLNQTKLNQTKLNHTEAPSAASDVKSFLKTFGDLWTRGPGQGKTYHCCFQKDTQLTKDLLKTMPLKEICALAEKFFQSNDPFITKSGYTIGMFHSQINKLRANGTPPRAEYHKRIGPAAGSGDPMPKELKDMASNLAKKMEVK